MRLVSILALAFGLICAQAGAATTTYLINFTATGDVTANGNYTLTFDPTQTYDNASTGLTVNSFNDGFGTVPNVGFSFGNNQLAIGGLASGVYGLTSRTDDYALLISGFTTAPVFNSFYVSSPTFDLTRSSRTGTVTVTPYVAVTPEPSSLALLGTGLVTAVAMIRRRLA